MVEFAFGVVVGVAAYWVWDAYGVPWFKSHNSLNDLGH